MTSSTSWPGARDQLSSMPTCLPHCCNASLRSDQQACSQRRSARLASLSGQHQASRVRSPPACGAKRVKRRPGNRVDQRSPSAASGNGPRQGPVRPCKLATAAGATCSANARQGVSVYAQRSAPNRRGKRCNTRRLAGVSCPTSCCHCVWVRTSNATPGRSSTCSAGRVSRRSA